ncbi:MAG: type II toxin-antitoxin system VapC family toxin [Anaerolineae bacterium]
MTYYLDSSAAVKLYVTETGSAWLRGLLLPEPQNLVVISSHLLCVEVWSAFGRRLRDGTVTPNQHTRIHDWFLQHRYELYHFKAVDEEIIQGTRRLFITYTLRAYDAIHLATALLANQHLLARQLPPVTFLCADDQLLAAAASEGLAVDNPNDHA